MTDIDPNKIAPGDTVGLRVAATQHNAGQIMLKMGGRGTWINTDAIVSHTPAPKPALKVGDRVRDGDGPVRTVAWIEDGHAFLSPLKGTTYMAPWTLSEVETWERLS